MTGSIFLVHDDDLVEMVEQPYDSEAVLQELLARYPDLLARDQIDAVTPRRWLLVSREAGVPDAEGAGDRWSIDHLFLDQDGIPTLVEVKRSSDTRIRREVVGQMLDYAANVVLHWPVARIQQMLDARCARAGLEPSVELARVWDDAAGPEEYWTRVKTNLEARRLRLVFVADVIPLELQRVVEFLNDQMGRTQVLAVEVKRYGSADGRATLVPRVIGQTAAAQQAKSATSDSGRQWDEASFFADLERRAGAEAARMARELQRWSERHGLALWWGKGAQDGSMIPIIDLPGGERTLLFSLWTYGRLEITFQYMSTGLFSRMEWREALRDRLNAIAGVSIPRDGLTRRPSVKLAVLARGDALARLADIFDWFVESARRGDATVPGPTDAGHGSEAT